MQLFNEFVQHFSGIAVISTVIVGPLFYHYVKNVKRFDDVSP